MQTADKVTRGAKTPLLFLFFFFSHRRYSLYNLGFLYGIYLLVYYTTND